MPFTPIHVLDLLRIDGFTAVVAGAVILVSALVLSRLRHGWPCRLLVIGAAALLVAVSLRFAFLVSFTYGWLQRTPLLEGDVVVPALTITLQLAEILSYCVWIGLVWIGVRMLRTRPNQAMQRTAR